MDTLELLGLSRRLFPRLAALAVFVALYFAPNFSAGLILRAAESRAREVTKALEDAF
jgi:F0F1-type ATP synthase membrane subunit b/b'